MPNDDLTRECVPTDLILPEAAIPPSLVEAVRCLPRLSLLFAFADGPCAQVPPIAFEVTRTGTLLLATPLTETRT